MKNKNNKILKILYIALFMAILVCLTSCNEHECLYSSVYNPPTCEKEGYTAYKCSCGKEYFDNYKQKLGHNYTSSYVIESASTCITKGYEVIKCQRENCGSIYAKRELPLRNHHLYNLNNVCKDCGDYGCYENQYIYTLNEDKTGYEISSYIGNYVNIRLPESYNNLPVVGINKNAFQCSTVKNVKIPNTVKYIKSSAFNASEIESIEVPDSVEYIEKNAFLYCNYLKFVKIGANVENIGEGAFSFCENLEDVDFNCNKKLKIIKNSLFKGSKITNIILPSSIETIEAMAFASSKLKNITFSENLLLIKENAFNNCTLLENVYISNIDKFNKIEFKSKDANPTYYAKNLYLNNKLVEEVVFSNDLSIIKENAYYSYKGLKKIVIPKTVLKIEDFAFYNCLNLVDIYYEGSIADWGNMVKRTNYIDGSHNVTIHCSDGDI